LPEGKFAVYVVPNDFTKKYDDSTKLFAFLANPILINNIARTDTLYAYQEYKKKDPKAIISSSTPKAKLTAEEKRLKYSANLESGQQDLLSALELNFARPLKTWDSSKIVLYDTLYQPIKGYKLSIDTSNTKISIEYPWKEKQYFRLIVSKDAVVDTNGISLTRSDTAKIVTKKDADYGSCRVRFVNLDINKHPVMQLVLESKIVASYPIAGKEFISKRFKPGEYELRMLYDTNQNGKWDPGSFKEKKQPEIVKSFVKKLIIRPDRDSDQSFIFNCLLSCHATSLFPIGKRRASIFKTSRYWKENGFALGFAPLKARRTRSTILWRNHCQNEKGYPILPALFQR